MHDPAIILPGIGGSGRDHWQSLWERRNSAFHRFQPSSWDAPDLEDWIKALDQAVDAANEPPFLVAHSLACLLVAHWAHRERRQVRGALLVGVPDPEGPNFPAAASSFGVPPENRPGFPALVIASENDPYGSKEFAAARAETWGAGFVVAGALGHINEASGLGSWPQGEALFAAFRAGAVADRAFDQ